MHWLCRKSKIFVWFGLLLLAHPLLLSGCEMLSGCNKKKLVVVEKKVQLVPAPASWGCPRDGSHGSITYPQKATGALNGTVELKNLKPQHTYALTLNGWEGRPGNEVLKPHGQDDKRGGVWDFNTGVLTDEKGNAQVRLNEQLLPQKYDVKFFVKDTAVEGWCIVLYTDSFSFEVVEE